MAAGFNNDANNCQVTEAIQSLPPELREIIYKHYLAIKLRERAALGWDLVHDELSIQPFCRERQRLVHILVCIAYGHCCRGGGVVTLVMNKKESFMYQPSPAPRFGILP